VKIAGRILIVISICATATIVFFDVISYLSGIGNSRIVALDIKNLTLIREDQIRFGGPGIHMKDVKHYKNPEGQELVILQTANSPKPGVFLIGRHKIYDSEGFKEIILYEPFVLPKYLLQRSAVLFILTLLIFAVAGLILKLIGKGQFDTSGTVR
jgi:hypothetical protein